MNKDDRKLGMDRNITRRDFLNGASVAVTGSLLSTPWVAALGEATNQSAQMAPGYYPPTRDGMRGSHPGSFEIAHLIRDGKHWGDPVDSVDTGEIYDLIVVGGGLSGLSAAYFYRRESGPDTRILIVDNHDDFGGHAKRNEFHYKGHMLVDLGGTEYIEAPDRYPKHARALIEGLGIDVSQAKEVFDHDLYPSLGLRGGVFFDKETFGKDRLVAGREGLVPGDRQTAYVTLPAELENGVGDKSAVADFLEKTPLSERARAEILELFCGDKDYLAGKSTAEKIVELESISYIEFLSGAVDASRETIDFFRMWRASYMGNGTDLAPAIDAMRYGLPGAKGLGLVETLRTTGYQPHSYKDDFHFPDGNASIARLLVRSLIPGVAPGNSMNDIISAKFDYSKLDQPDSRVKLRLNSTAVHVRHVNDRTVEMTYVEGDQARRVRAKHCVMACYHSIVPHICPELPEGQKYALANTIRMPLVSINVLVDNWKAFQRLGIFAAYCPGSYCSDIRLTYPLRFGDYASARSPEEPMTVHMYRIPLPGGDTTVREQFWRGRYELLSTTFETFERQVRDQLGRLLKDGGFNAARDIKAITVNRWPHGYAVGYDTETETMNYSSGEWPDEKKLWLTGRRRHGRIAFANTDAGAMAMTEEAIEQAHRATQELLHEG
ncbi:MAG: NAD(P)/FAD-dependent oxidoreductase [Gammaproteobacteria bacterium]|nr:NAD(P)/FAD-dependent oxidoreductase [Gammaproteobacteria bacterium]